jgi:hypothetical protein
MVCQGAQRASECAITPTVRIAIEGRVGLAPAAACRDHRAARARWIAHVARSAVFAEVITLERGADCRSALAEQHALLRQAAVPACGQRRAVFVHNPRRPAARSPGDAFVDRSVAVVVDADATSPARVGYRIGRQMASTKRIDARSRSITHSMPASHRIASATHGSQGTRSRHSAPVHG